MDYKQLLENRHTTFLEWREPWPACGPQGNDLDAHVSVRANVHDCINLQRVSDRSRGDDTIGNDERRLADFITTHWCTVIPPPQGLEDAEILVNKI
jgi:hypothetical protein